MVIRKLRFDRGPLRWWLLVAGVVLIDFAYWRFAVGTALVLLGVALDFVSKGYLCQNRVLATSGPYRFSRNPFYLGNLLIDGGLLWIIGSWVVAAVYLVTWVVVYYRTIREEEKALESIFGRAYDDYRRAVPRLCPRPWKYLSRRQSGSSRFSLYNCNILGGPEIPRAVQRLSYPLALYAAAGLHGYLGWVKITPAGWPLAAVEFVLLRGLALGVRFYLRCHFERTPNMLAPPQVPGYPSPSAKRIRFM